MQGTGLFPQRVTGYRPIDHESGAGFRLVLHAAGVQAREFPSGPVANKPCGRNLWVRQVLGKRFGVREDLSPRGAQANVSNACFPAKCRLYAPRIRFA